MTAWVIVDKAVKEPCPNCHGDMSVFGGRALCPACGASYRRQKPLRSNRLVVELTDGDVARMLARAISDNPRDFAILGFLASGFRRSEVVGGDDNGVELPGVYVEDIQLEQQGVRVVGKGQSPAIREGRDPKRILQPVPRIFLEAALSRGFEKGLLFEDVNTHQVGDMVKYYARLAAVPEWQEARPHQLRHWYSNAVRKRIGNQGPTALLEWADTMRHSRKAAQSVTVAFYSGAVTSFERRLEICLAAFQPVLEQLQSPTFIQLLPAPLLAPTDRPTIFRVHQNSIISEKGPSSERDNNGIFPILRIDLKPVIAPVDPVSPAPAKEEPVDEPPVSEPVVDPFREEETPALEPVVETDPRADEPLETSETEPEPPVTLPPTPPSRDEILKAWTDFRSKQRDGLMREREFIKQVWKGRDRKDRLRRLLCNSPGCGAEAVARDETGWVCEQHCPTLRGPPEGWLPARNL